MNRTGILGGALLLALCATASGAAPAPLQAEQARVEKLGPHTPHWFFVYDINFLAEIDSKSYLFDGDTGSMLGMLSTGAWGTAIEFAPDFSAVYVPETYYARGSRGERTDVVTIYDTTELKPIGEVIIPPKRASGIPHRAYQGISDDGAFVYVDNMTPATSVSVVDVAAKKFVGEIEIAGCNLIYPTGKRSFASLCGDGTLQVVQLDDQGKLVSKTHSEKFFDPDKDPLTEKASRQGDTWLFFSFDGYVHPVSFAGGKIKVGKRWSLFSDKERADNWKVGGAQFNAVHRDLERLYVIVHQGGPYGHKDPGTAVWVYDLKTQKGVAQFKLNSPATNVAVTKDAAPLLITDDGAKPLIDVYDALTGKPLRSIAGPPFTPSFIQSP
jgi:methylamine dehydrogenase heavy chain